MPQTLVHKVIVTNESALKKKYGTAGLKKIRSALAKLSKADQKRGLSSRVISIDRAGDMNGIGKRVTKTTNTRQVKRAIADVCATLRAFVAHGHGRTHRARVVASRH